MGAEKAHCCAQHLGCLMSNLLAGCVSLSYHLPPCSVTSTKASVLLPHTSAARPALPPPPPPLAHLYRHQHRLHVTSHLPICDPCGQHHRGSQQLRQCQCRVKWEAGIQQPTVEGGQTPLISNSKGRIEALDAADTALSFSRSHEQWPSERV